MSALYLRRLELFIGGANLQISDLLVQFNVSRKGTATPAEGEITVYNLNDENERRVRQRGESIRLSAGYHGSRFGVLAIGEIRGVERERSGLDRLTRIEYGGHVETRSNATVSLSYEGEIPVRTIIADLVAKYNGVLTLGSLALVPADAVEEDYVYNGRVDSAMSQVLEAYGLIWFDDNGNILVTEKGKQAPDRARDLFFVSERTGMVGTPSVTDDGLVVKTLIDHRIGLDSRVQVESSNIDPPLGSSDDVVPERRGLWKVTGLNHVGDNREGDFNTIMDLRPLGGE